MHAHTFVRKQHITNDIWTFWFEGPLESGYQAGQFVGLTLHHPSNDDRGEHRWFTLSSSPTEPLLGITTRIVTKPSSFMQALDLLQPGETVTVSDAMGDFVLPMGKQIPLLFVVAGIGITPVRSMLQWLKDSNQSRDVTVLYTASNTTDLAYTTLLESAGKVEYFVKTGPNPANLTPKTVLQFANQHSNGLVYVSGPESFVEYMVEGLRETGLASSRLVTDYFPGYDG